MEKLCNDILKGECQKEHELLKETDAHIQGIKLTFLMQISFKSCLKNIIFIPASNILIS